MNLFVVTLVALLLVFGATNHTAGRGIKSKQKNSWWSKRGMLPPLPSPDLEAEVMLSHIGAASPRVNRMNLNEMEGHIPAVDPGQPYGVTVPCVNQGQQYLTPTRYWLLRGALTDLARQYIRKDPNFSVGDLEDN